MSTYRPATSKKTRDPDKQLKYYTTRISVLKNFGLAGEGIAQYSRSFWTLTPIKDVEISGNALY